MLYTLWKGQDKRNKAKSELWEYDGQSLHVYMYQVLFIYVLI